MSNACTPILVGVTSSVSEILLLFNFSQISLLSLSLSLSLSPSLLLSPSLFLSLSRALKEADVILLVGARLNWILHFGRPPRFDPNVKIIQVCPCASRY